MKLASWCALKFCCKLDAPSYSHLRAEATAMAAFRSADAPHPLLVCPLACSNPPGRSANYSLLMPLCPGGDLLQLLRRQDTARARTPRVNSNGCGKPHTPARG